MSNIYDNKRKMIKQMQEQEALKEKYEIEDDVVIKETDNMGKFLIRTFSSVIRLCASILLAALAAIGLTTLAYPDVRAALFTVIKRAIESIF